MDRINIALTTDSYKATHARQYPPGTEHVYSYFESRGAPGEWSGGVVFFGLQYILSRLTGAVVTKGDVDEAAEVWRQHFGIDLFNRAGWIRIVEKHGGRLPLVIRAVPEGTVVPAGNVMMTVENTDPECFWLTNWLETYILQVWYPCTVATQSREMKIAIRDSLAVSGGLPGLPFKLHDFGYRGVSSLEQAAIGGAAHLVNFQGTDTMAGILLLRDHYGAQMPGVSIPASEHSTITSWGVGHEVDAFRNMLDQYPTGLVACVSDSYDIERACRDYWGSELREKVLARDGVLVVRPDSGDPRESVLGVLATLGKAFGYSKNSQGYKVLPPQVRVIQGDGIDLSSVKDVLSGMLENGWSADNVAFGSGGGLLQKLNRDTLQCAFKCSHIDGVGFSRDVYKDPVGMASKRSKRGRLKLVQPTYGKWVTCNANDPLYAEHPDALREVFRDGELMARHSLGDIRERASI